MPDGQARDGILNLRVRPEERAAIQAEAARKGLPVGVWARNMLRKAAGLAEE